MLTTIKSYIADQNTAIGAVFQSIGIVRVMLDEGDTLFTIDMNVRQAERLREALRYALEVH